MRLIDADTICEGMVGGWQTVLIKAQVDTAPTVDAVVVTRCKDCKHEFGGSCIICGFQKRKPDDFCSYGERKDKADAEG